MSQHQLVIAVLSKLQLTASLDISDSEQNLLDSQ